MKKGFSLNNGQGARLDVKAVHEISPGRCRRSGTNCAVIIGDVAAGTFIAGDKIALLDSSGKELLDDYVARLEIGCKQRFEVPKGSRVGMLLMKHAPGELLGLGIPRHHVHHPPAAHPYRL